MDLTVLSMLWISLAIFVMLLSTYFLRLYSRKKDPRKLMFAIAFLLSGVTYVYLATGYRGIHAQSLFWLNLYYWSMLPIMAVLLFVAGASLFRIKKFDLLFRLLLIIIAFSFLAVFLPFSIADISSYIRQLVGLAVIIVSVSLLAKTRDPINLMFLISMVCFTVSGMALVRDMEYFSIFSNLMAYIFMAMIFVVYPTSMGNGEYGVGSYFSLKKKLESTEKKLDDSERRYKKLFDASPDLIAEVDEDGTLRAVNSAMAESMGFSPDELIGKNISDVLPKEVIARRMKIARKALKEGKTQVSEDSRKGRYFHNAFVPVTVPSGVKSIQVIARDVTELKEVEKALRESEEKYRTLTENVNIGIYRNTAGPKGKFIEINPALTKLFRYKNKEEILKLNISDLYYTPEDRKKFNQKMLKNGFVKNEELNLMMKDGSALIGSVSAVVVKDEKGNVKYYDGIIEDITERKKTEEVLQESEAQLRTVLDNATIHIWAFNGEWYSYLSEEWYRYTGQDPKLPKTIERWTEMVHPDDLDEATKIWLKAWNNKDVYDGYFRLKGAEGGYRLFHSHAVPIYDENGNLLRYQGYNINITERKRAEEKLRESEEKYRDLAENMTDIAYSMDLNGILTYISPQTKQYGIDPETLISRNLMEIIHPEDQENVAKDYQRALEAGEGFPSTFRVLDAKGVVHWFEDVGKIQRDKDGNITGLTGVLRDITKRKQAEEERKQLIGELQAKNIELDSFTYIVSHDLKEPLRSLSTFSEFLLEDYSNKLDKTGKDYLERLQKAAVRMNFLISDLLKLSRIGREKIEFEDVDLNKLLHEVQEELAAALKDKDADIGIGSLPVIRCQRTLMGELFKNIIGNGIT